MSDPIDADSPDMRAALARLARLLGGQLEQAAIGIEGGQCTPWGACAFAGRLDKLRYDIEYLIKDVKKLKPAEEEAP